MKTILKIAAGIIVATVLLGVGCAALIGGAADQASQDLEEERVAEAADVADEVTCGPDDIGWARASGRVTNSSSGQSSYFITVTFADAEGVQYAEGIASVTDLASGATAEWDTSGLEDWRDGTTCAVSDVDRLAS
jgi:hypothetical protein